MKETRESRRALWMLAVGATAGLVVAVAGLLDRPVAGWLPSNAVAVVNGVEIRSADFERLVAGVERDSRAPASAEVRERVLRRMIEEELLVQRALDLGLAQADRRVRANLVSAVIGSVTSEAEMREADSDELREFYTEDRAFFTQPGRARLRQVFVRVPEPDLAPAAQARALNAAERLRAGESLDRVRDELGDREISPIPDVLLPPQKLLEYLGPTALRTGLALEPGETSDPVRSGTGIHVLHMVASEDPVVPPFAEIEDLVRAEWTRRQGDRALREYLDDLRADAEIVQ